MNWWHAIVNCSYEFYESNKSNYQYKQTPSLVNTWQNAWTKMSATPQQLAEKLLPSMFLSLWQCLLEVYSYVCRSKKGKRNGFISGDVMVKKCSQCNWPQYHSPYTSCLASVCTLPLFQANQSATKGVQATWVLPLHHMLWVLPGLVPRGWQVREESWISAQLERKVHASPERQGPGSR